MLKQELRHTLSLAAPMVLGLASQQLIQFIDALMVSSLGTVPLAASALGGSVFCIPFVLLMGLPTAVGITVAAAAGAKDEEDKRNWRQSGTLMAFLIGLPATLLLLLSAPSLGMLGQPHEVVVEAGPYYACLALSVVPALLFGNAKSYSEATGVPWHGLIAVVSMLACNVFFNWLLIFGNLGFPALGLLGAGIASIAARLCGLLYLIIALRPSPGLPASIRASWGRLRTLFKIGITSGLQTAFEVTGFVVATIWAGWLGTAQLAAHQIVTQVATLTFMVVLGSAQATGLRVSHHTGGKHARGIRLAGWCGWGLNALIMVFSGLMLWTFRSSIAGWFTSDPQIAALVGITLIVVAFNQLFDGTQAAMACALRGIKDVVIPTWALLAIYYGCGMPLAYLLGLRLGWGVTGLWVGLSVGLLLSSVFLTHRFYHRTRRLHYV